MYRTELDNNVGFQDTYGCGLSSNLSVCILCFVCMIVLITLESTSGSVFKLKLDLIVT